MADDLVIRATRFNNLSLSEDDLGDGPVAVFLYIPDMECDDHEHIELSLEEAERVRDWLDDFIGGHSSHDGFGD